jgi:hypothetical protein
MAGLCRESPLQKKKKKEKEEEEEEEEGERRVFFFWRESPVFWRQIQGRENGFPALFLPCRNGVLKKKPFCSEEEEEQVEEEEEEAERSPMQMS